MQKITKTSSGTIRAKQGVNTRLPYNHQKEAMNCLNIIDKEKAYSTLLVIPTGGGKTYTAATWLLKNAIDKKKKIIWIAHRQMLLDQAAESFQNFAYSENIPHVSEFKYRIISGSKNHDRVIDIESNDNILIVSKDSIGRNLNQLDEWLYAENEIYVVVDEAHHSTAKTYRKILNYINDKVKNIKLIGLTATPFRTAEEENGLLSKIYCDGVGNDNNIIKNGKGIVYQIGLKDLINARILSKPIFESYYSDEDFGQNVGLEALESILKLDALPEEIAKDIANSATRNKLIVDTYKSNMSRYGKTIVFAVNVVHAIALNKLFNNAGIKSDYVVSDIRNSMTGVSISREDNDRKIKLFKDGKLQVLINVNILTEGVDLPETKTVFLARPTVSTILMTQMIGRALRGTAAGGTDDAYIVSFIDRWSDNIAWVNPETLFTGNNDFIDNDDEYIKREIRNIAISKIEEFASILDESVNTSSLEAISFMKRIPVGIYAFSYLLENGMDLSYQVMVYDSTQQAYEELMNALPELFKSYNIDEEYLSDEVLHELEKICRNTYFCGEMLPPYESKDVINILKYYAQYETVPKFYTFAEIDRNKLDISKIAQHIWDEDMGPRKKSLYIDEIWDDADDNLLKLFFGKKIYFIKQLDIELMKLSDPAIYDDCKDNIIYNTRDIEELPLNEIGKIDANLEKYLRDSAFNKFMTPDGEYYCPNCGIHSKNRVLFHVDHIIPMNKGGKSVSDNLQILCRKCNAIKGDRIE